MFFAIAALMIHPQIAPKLTFSAEKFALIDSMNPVISSNEPANEASLPPVTESGDNATPETGAQPVAESNVAALPDAPVAVEAPAVPAMILAKPVKPVTVSVGELRAEYRRKQIIWRGLAIASSGAATFDAWSTRRAVAAGSQEMNPMLRPFAGNASLYAAVQVGPVLMDYLGKKMMYSRHEWVRRMWWVPQSASFAGSLFCGAHNLSFH